MERMLSVEEVAVLVGKTARTVRNLINSGILTADIVRDGVGRGGVTYRIPLDALPAEMQIRYQETNY